MHSIKLLPSFTFKTSSFNSKIIKQHFLYTVIRYSETFCTTSSIIIFFALFLPMNIKIYSRLCSFFKYHWWIIYSFMLLSKKQIAVIKQTYQLSSISFMCPDFNYDGEFINYLLEIFSIYLLLEQEYIFEYMISRFHNITCFYKQTRYSIFLDLLNFREKQHLLQIRHVNEKSFIL